ncbi:YicC/YloC family endoribonuclease [Paenibacillus sp. 453mf]|uniref:YicC/YloC family endoribonuclease n=1 Tax=Paenibacillus sp. 453mf TaxID=1761874 RepID=UPI0008F42AA2|nr:YicC/YloC family endoribonuclease [Paenibacillus sp. 453mf]SFS60710.1 TIGR00255 family protein [Paenibacillus sp. 453mf]
MSFSMTGYGQYLLSYGGYKVQFEVKSVNHRYCEVVFRMPREWSRFEDGLRRMVQRKLARGRIDVFITREFDDSSSRGTVLNKQMVASYLEASGELESSFGMKGNLTISEMLQLPGVFVNSEEMSSLSVFEDQNWETALQEGLALALDELLDMRSREGNHLAADLKSRIMSLQAHHAAMIQLAPAVVTEYRSKLKQRLTEISDAPFDEHKFGMEIAIFADRSNIDEELTRLSSHMAQCEELLTMREPIGRKLDFLIQEMNREVNTIGTKAHHLGLVNLVVEMKAELEKIREQAANLE